MMSQRTYILKKAITAFTSLRNGNLKQLQARIAKGTTNPLEEAFDSKTDFFTATDLRRQENP